MLFLGTGQAAAFFGKSRFLAWCRDLGFLRHWLKITFRTRRPGAGHTFFPTPCSQPRAQAATQTGLR